MKSPFTTRLTATFCTTALLLVLCVTTARGVTLYNHLDFPGQFWADGHGDYICVRGPITSLATTLPPNQYMIVTADKRWLWTFTTYDDTPAGTVVDNYQHCRGDAGTLGITPYGSGDFHAAYLINYYTGNVVGTADGGFSANAAPVLGGTPITVDVPVAYTFTYGAVPSDLNEAGGNGDTCPGMAQYSLNKSHAALVITDTPISYLPPRGPAINFTLSYNSKAGQPGGQGFPYLGPGWTFNWYSYLVDDPMNVSVTVYLPGGNTEQTTGYNPNTFAYAPDPYSKAVLAKVTNGYERRLPDGSKQVFTTFNGTALLFMTQWIDDANNAVILTYDVDLLLHEPRLTIITDALGKKTTLHYDDQSNGRSLTSITNDFSKSTTFSYTDGKLTAIEDPVGIVSTFGWEDNFINSLTTPYGQTTFVQGGSASNRWLEVTDPELGKERVEYRDGAPGIYPTDPADTVPPGFTNAGLDVRNSFYWDKKATAMFPPVNGVYDYTKARITHWLLTSDGSFISRVPSSEKAPLENRLWYSYPGQSDSSRMGSLDKPSTVARMLNPTIPQISHFQYNSIGNTTKTTDPAGRVQSYVYDTNNIDVLRGYQRNPLGASTDPDGLNADKIATYTYNPPHRPHTVTDAAGQTATYVYNSNGQVLTSQNAKGEITTYAYGNGTSVPLGYLASITSPAFNGSSAVTTFTYDNANRVHTVTNSPDDYTITTDYDNLDRKTRVTYPDATYEQFAYTQDFGQGPKTILGLTASKDRLDRWTYRHYNRNRQMDSIRDPLNRPTLYDWCTCGSLTRITDPKGNATTFNRDLQSRVYQKVFANTTTISYLFEGQTGPNTVGTTSRLKSSTDALYQTTNYQYFSDDDIQQISYTNAQHATPTVTYTYDPNYNRLSSMLTGGLGTTNYTYYSVGSNSTLGANRLHTASGPFSNDTIAYTYDELGRALGQDINGTNASVDYDSLGRLGTATNALGSFTHDYDGVTPRLQTLTYPNEQTANYTYFGNDHDRRLHTLQHLTREPGNLSSHDYTHDAEGQVMSWSKVLGVSASPLWFEYDDAQQLLGARNASDASSATHRFDYVYDGAGNRTSDAERTFIPQIQGGQPGASHNYTVNALNQITTSIVTSYYPQVHSEPAVSFNYDLAGNMIYDGVNMTFEWDTANRLSAINHTDTGERTEFAYDGLGRRIKITEYGPGVTATIQPKGINYTPFNTAPFTLPAGSYTLTFEGLNSNGDNVALIDAVTLNNTLVANGSFENPDVSSSQGGYEFNPPNATWTFIGATGIAFNGSDFTYKDAPDGQQVAFIQNAGVISQTCSVSAGTYTLSFQAAQGGANTADQQLRVTLRPSGAAVKIKTFVWCGNQICEERDSSGATVTKRFFAEGEQRIGGRDAGNYYYSRDHLGSIREVTDATGALKAQYDYDPYGKAVVVAGDMNVDFGYTGHYFHASSGLNLTLYRAYSPTLGRWLSRDPIGEKGGINLYVYVQNDAINGMDPLGLDTYFYFRPDQGSSANGSPIDFGHVILDSNGHYLDHVPGRFLSPDQRSDWQYYYKFQLDLTPEQESQLARNIDDLKRMNPDYGLNSYCSKDVADVLNQVKYKRPVDGTTPSSAWLSVTSPKPSFHSFFRDFEL